MTKKIIFVCLGNICRSPMAEAYFRDLVTKAGCAEDFQFDSAATSRYEIGHPPHHGTQQLLAKKGISTAGITARQVTSQDFENADILFGMDQQNVADLRRLAPNEQAAAKVYLFCESLPTEDPREIPDPYYTGDFEETYRLVSAASQAWFKQWQAEKERDKRNE